ncbi:MAG: T9SS type A sorting domain-containing protein [Bacteroidota bacterium]
MKKHILLLSLLLGAINFASAQVLELNYLIEYNETSELYDCKIVITNGQATTFIERIQFNTQYTIVVPHGTMLSIEELHNPIENNGQYTGTIPCLWEFGPKELAPPTASHLDFHAIFPNLSPPSYYNNIYAGDTITLFSVSADLDPCSNLIRPFENGIDPSSFEMPSGGDFSNGMAIGGPDQKYDGNLKSIYRNYISPNDTLHTCMDHCITLSPTIPCFTDPLEYEWSTGETTETIEVCPSESTSYNLWLKDEDGNYLDSIPVTVEVDLIYIFTTKREACAGSSILLEACPASGTWAQSSANGFGASLSPLPGGIVEVTFSEFVSGTFDFIYSIPGLSDTIRITVYPAPLVNISNNQLCIGQTAEIASNIPGGEWQSNNPDIAYYDVSQNEVIALSPGDATFTYVSPFGCSATTGVLSVTTHIDAQFTGPSVVCVGDTTFVSPTSGGIWTSSDVSVGIVDDQGIVYTNSPGIAHLIFVDSFSGCQSISLELYVDQPLTELTGTNRICIGETTTLYPSFGGSWRSSNPSIATIDNFGNVTGVGEGEVYFVFTNATTLCESQPSEVVYVSTVNTIEIEDEILCPGESTVLIADAIGTWASDNPFVATVDVNTGVVTALNEGTTGFSFTTSAGCTKSSDPISVTVLSNHAEVTGLSTICVDGTTSLFPATGGVWTFNGLPIVSIENGEATGLIEGTTTLTFTYDNTGCVSGPVQITVADQLEPPLIEFNFPVCEGDDLMFSTDYIEGALYHWTGPNGYTSSDQNPLIQNVNPSDEGEYNLYITVDGCESGTSTIYAEVLPTPSTPNADSNSPICAGEDLLLTTDFVAGAVYNWTGPDGFTSSNQNPTISNVSEFVSGTYCLELTIDGCLSDAACVDVMVLPELTAPVITSNEPVCEGENIELVAELIPGASYEWFDPSGNPIESGPTVVIPNAESSDAGLYCVDVYNDACNSSRCIAVNVLSIPPTLEVFDNGPICEGEDLKLFADFVFGATYSWTGPDGFVSTDQNPEIFGTTTASSGDYCVEISIGNCESIELCTEVIVISRPVTPEAFNNGPICEGDDLELTTQAVISGTYAWTGPNGFTSTDQNPSIINTTPSFSGSYCIVVYVDGCESHVGCTVVTINPIPSSPMISSNNPICEGESIELSANSVTGAIYSWTGPNGFISFDQNPVISDGSLLDGGTYCLATIVNGCESETVCTDVFINDVPAIPSISSNSPLCAGESLELTANSIPGATYIWTGPTGMIFTDQNPVITGIGLIPGVYSLVVSINGCESDAATTVVEFDCIEPASSCAEIAVEDIICDYTILDEISGEMMNVDSGGDQPLGELCEDGDGAHNMNWYAFVALEGDYDIVATITNGIPSYLGGELGAQVGIYSDCSFSEESKIYCESQQTGEAEFRISSDLFTVGQTYYLYIDGFDRSIFYYFFDVEGFYDNSYCTELSKVTGVAYADANENGSYDEGETLLRNALISLEPGNLSVLTNNEGRYIINTPKGGATLTAKMNEGHWIEDEITIEDLTIFESCVEGIDFGFVPNLFYQEAKISVANSITRCDWETRFTFTVENTGTIDLDGTIEFEFDDKTSFFDTNINGLQVNGNIASAPIGIIKPFEVSEFWIKLKMPPGSISLPVLDFKTTVFNSAGDDLDVYEQSEQLRCSYDPNDKREFPNREGEDNLTLMDEEIEYTIRFQNNGNDTAFLVKIIDPLDPNIDKTSIRVISASHSVETCIENETLIFLFEDIYLVDSMTNYDGSQGYVSYRCRTKEGRPEYTLVHNTADIIFDTNVPIVTNTTINTLVSELCSDVVSEVDIEICDGEDYNGYDESGTFTEIYPLQYGCDSMVIINLEVQGITYSSQELHVCEGESFELNGEEYVLYNSQEIRDTIYNALGCISNVLIFDVEVNPDVAINIDTTICEGLEYYGYTESGIYTIDSFDAVTGCDIVTTIDLEVLPISDPACIVGFEEQLESEIKLFPNPAKQYFTIEGQNGIESLSIYTMTYEKVEEIMVPENGQKVQISTEKLQSGLYLVVIGTNGKVFYKRVVVE